MRNLFLALLVIALAGCVTQPATTGDFKVSATGYVTETRDAIAQGYIAIKTVAESTEAARRNGTLTNAQAQVAKQKLQEAKNLLDAAVDAPQGSTESETALAQAQAALNVIRQFLGNRGESYE